MKKIVQGWKIKQIGYNRSCSQWCDRTWCVQCLWLGSCLSCRSPWFESCTLVKWQSIVCVVLRSSCGQAVARPVRVCGSKSRSPSYCFFSFSDIKKFNLFFEVNCTYCALSFTKNKSHLIQQNGKNNFQSYITLKKNDKK